VLYSTLGGCFCGFHRTRFVGLYVQVELLKILKANYMAASEKQVAKKVRAAPFFYICLNFMRRTVTKPDVELVGRCDHAPSGQGWRRYHRLGYDSSLGFLLDEAVS